ncbi:MAG: heme exporter protein CcmD [Sterolibacterium sp.]|nr:heme exporter protein CcmD [Sterolibacterium sp.]
MNWHQWLEFLQMGGYAFHVWGSYLLVPVLMLVEIVLLLLRKRSIIGHLGWRTFSRSASGNVSQIYPTGRPELVAGQLAAPFMMRQAHPERRQRHERRQQHDRRSQHHDRRQQRDRRSPHFQIHSIRLS